MYSEQLLDHFRNPRNVGELPSPAITAEAINPACGDIMRLSAEFRDGRIHAVAYKTRGCTASIACGSALTELLTGRTAAEAAGIDGSAVESAVGGLIPESKHAAQLCVDVLKVLLKSAPRA